MDITKYKEIVAGSPRGQVLKALLETHMQDFINRIDYLNICRMVDMSPEELCNKLITDILWVCGYQNKDIESFWKQQFGNVAGSALTQIVDQFIEGLIYEELVKVAPGPGNGAWAGAGGSKRDF